MDDHGQRTAPGKQIDSGWLHKYTFDRAPAIGVPQRGFDLGMRGRSDSIRNRGRIGLRMTENNSDIGLQHVREGQVGQAG